MALSVALPLAGLETENFNSFSSFDHIIDIAGLSQTSPSPSSSSESSGIGSLGSLKSESVNIDSLPSSPQTTEKKIFEPVISELQIQVEPEPEPKRQEEIIQDVKIMYEGHDILDLFGNITNKVWNFHPTLLPPNNPTLFFANRSQYHRLGPTGTTVHYMMSGCGTCGFSWVVAAVE